MRRRAPWFLAVGLLAGHLAAEAREPAPDASLARFFPAKDLVAYAEFGGLDAHSASWKKTATYRLLTETTTGAMLDATAEQLLSRLLQASPPPSGVNLTGKDLLAIAKRSVTSGFALGMNRGAGQARPSSVTLVLAGAAKGEGSEAIRRLLDSVAGSGAKPRVETKAGGRKVTTLAGPRADGPGVSWWFEGDDLVLSILATAGPEAVIAALDGKAPNATTHPLRAELAKAEGDFEPVGLAFVVREAFPALPPQADRLGLNKIERLDYRWGFRGPALATVSRMIAPAPRTGLLALLEQPTFGADALPPIPAGANSVTAVSMDLDRLFDQFVAIAAMGDPNAPEVADGMANAFRDASGVRLREDLLKALGPKFVAYTVPTRGVLPTNPIAGFASGYLHTAKAAAIVEVRDRAGFERTFRTLADRLNEGLRARLAGEAPEAAKGIGLLPLKGPEVGYRLVLPPSLAPLPAGMRPTLLLGKANLVIGTTPEVARTALALQDGPRPPADPALAEAMAGLPRSMIVLHMSDTRASLLPEVVANLPTILSAFSALNTRGNVAPAARLLGSGGWALDVDPDLIPDPDALRPYLFPATYTVTADARGFTFASREAFPGLNPTTAAPLAAAALFPAVTSARAAARRAQSVNNLKQIGLAMHNYESANAHLPGPVRDADGKALLSWRVQLLPYLEAGNLYQEFHLDEPWDSPHNKPLADRMPEAFRVPNSDAAPNLTFYRGFSGPGALLDPEAEGMGFAGITDGTSNTLAVVEAKEAVPWTQPENEVPFQPGDEGLLGKLGGHSPGGFNALLMDGSVRFIRATINPNTLWALITRNGGEVIPGDAY